MTVEKPDQTAAPPPEPRGSRPRPQYGEYATPQDQATAMGLSMPPISPALRAPVAPDETARMSRSARGQATETPVTAAERASAARSTTAPAPAPSARGHASRVGSERDSAKPRRWDFILTSILLAYATWNVVSQVFISSDLSGVINQFYEANAIGAFAPTELSATLGGVLNVVTILLFVVTVFLTSRLLRSGRVAFWVPIAGGALSVTIALVFVAVIVMGDPAFVAYSGKIGQ